MQIRQKYLFLGACLFFLILSSCGDLDNFIEYDKVGTISYNINNFSIIYKKNAKDKNNNIISYLVFRKLNEEPTDIIIHEGYRIYNYQYELFENDIVSILFSSSQEINESSKYYLVVFDLNNMILISKNIIPETAEYSRMKLSNEYSAYILEDGIDKYIHEDSGKKIFFIEPNTANDFFKSKYFGTYINDNINNIRISRVYDHEHYTYPAAWLENGRYVVFGGYLFDTLGKLNEIKIIDGTILSLFQVGN